MTIDDAFGALAAYEIFAVASGRLPPITQICRRHRLACLPVVGIVLLHLVKEKL